MRLPFDTGDRAGSLSDEMTTDPAPQGHAECLELSVDELLRRARPLPPRDTTVIEDLIMAGLDPHND